MDAVATSHFVPPTPLRPLRPLPLSEFLRIVTNAISMRPAAASAGIDPGGIVGRRSILVNAPDIHHILVGNPGNSGAPGHGAHPAPDCRQGAAALEGDELETATAPLRRLWRTSCRCWRRTSRCTKTALNAYTNGEPVNLLGVMQALALEIAGQSMFSMETQSLRKSCAA